MLVVAEVGVVAAVAFPVRHCLAVFLGVSVKACVLC